MRVLRQAGAGLMRPDGWPMVALEGRSAQRGPLATGGQVSPVSAGKRPVGYCRV